MPYKHYVKKVIGPGYVRYKRMTKYYPLPPTVYPLRPGPELISPPRGFTTGYAPNFAAWKLWRVQQELNLRLHNARLRRRYE